MKYKLTINDLLCGRWFLSLIALLLMSVEMQAEETSTTYTFSGMSAVSGADYQYEVTSTSGGASETWKIKNFSATDESYHNRTTSVYVFDTQSVGISNIFATSESATIIKFQLVSDFVLHGDFVSAEITYSTSGMSYSNAVVCKVGNSSYSMLTDTSEQLGTSPATISLKSLYEDEKYFNDQKVALDFTFITNKFDGYDGEFSIQSVKITTTPATDYNLWVGGVQVNSGNASNILNDDNNPTAVFDVSTNTLTLNNATINGNVVSGLADDLTVHLVGTNTINTQGTKAFVSTLQSEPSLTFTAANGGLLKTNIPRTQGDAVISSGFSDNIPEDYKMSWDADGFCSLGQYYGLYLYTFVNDNSYFQPYYVTAANCDRLMGKYNESNNSWDNTVITISYDDSEKTLTLNNASPESAAPYGTTYLINCDGANVRNITVMLLGENTLRQYPEESGAGFIRNNLYEGTVTITTDPSNPGRLTMPDLDSYYQEDYVLSAEEVIYKNGLGYEKDENNVRYIRTLPSIGLTVAGVPVNASNASNVLDELNENDEPTVVFDADNNTLTLNNANIYVESEDVVVSGLDNLTIFLVGENYITSYGNSSFAFNKSSAVTEATITFTTNAVSNGSLTITKDESLLSGEGVTLAYTNVLKSLDGWTHTITSRLGISVGGVPVTLFNSTDVFGDETVSFTPAVPATDNTPAVPTILTLNGATIESDEEQESPGIVYENEDDLTIALIGNNSVRGSYNCSAITHYNGEVGLSFVKGDAAQHFSLTMIADSEEGWIDGFEANYGDFFVFDNEDDGTYTRTISSSVYGGTGTADEPFLIKTADDLKKFAYHYNEGRFSNNVHIQLFNDIDCENEEGFTTIADNTDATFYGVFDGNHKTISNLTITGIGFFGYVERDGNNVGTIKDLTLSGLHLTATKGYQEIGGIVGYLDGDAVINNCTVVNSTITSALNEYNPYVGGIVGKVNGGTVSSCVVGNGTKITANYANEYTGYAGAIVGQATDATLSENYYYYDVTVEILSGTDTDNKAVKSGYMQRGLGEEMVISDETYYDIFEDNGAVMYTQKLTLPEETEEASVVAEEDTYYAWAESEDGVLVAPGQTMRLNTFPGDGYVITSLTVTNTATSTEISTSSEDFGDNITQYMFTMPDAPVTVTLTTQEKMGIRVAGIEITEANAGDVLGDGKVSYDVESNTLTLNGATVNGCIYNYNESKPNLTVYLQGENVIDGGYVSDDENGDWAFGTDVANARLYITTDEEDPGQLLIKNSYLNEWGNPEYYKGCYPAKKNGLTESQNYNDMKALIATAPVVTPGEGLYWTDQQYEVSTLLGGSVGYRDGMGHFSEKTYDAPFKMETAGKYNLSVWEEVTVDETDFSLYANGSMYIVHNKPEFSLEEGTYYDAQIVKIENLPSLPENPNYYPQVWYYLNDNKNDSIQYTSAEQEIALTESAKVCVYILDEDSGKVVKSAPVEAEYTIIDKMQLNISYAQNSRTWASYCADENLETPEGLQAYVVTGLTEDGVSVEAIDYIPQGVGVLLKRTKEIAEPIKAKPYTGAETETPDNLLSGTTEGTAVGSETGNVYVLYNDGFTRATKGTIPAHRAYLVLAAETEAEGRLSIFEDETTALKLVNSEERIVNSEVYDLQGRKVNHSSLFTSGKATLKKGLYILNGKKQVIK